MLICSFTVSIPHTFLRLLLTFYKKSIYLIVWDPACYYFLICLCFSQTLYIHFLSLCLCYVAPSARIPFLLFSINTDPSHSLRSNANFSKKPSLIVLSWSDHFPLCTPNHLLSLHFAFTFHQTTIAKALWVKDPCLTNHWLLRTPCTVTFIQKLL